MKTQSGSVVSWGANRCARPATNVSFQWLRMLSRNSVSLLLLGAASAMWSVPAFGNNPTDSDGYIQSWPGNTVLQYNGNFLPLSSLIQPLSQQLAQGAQSVPSTLCNQIRTAVANMLKGNLSGWDSCSAGTTPELRGKMLGPNELGLKIIISNVSFSFDYYVGMGVGSPTINVTTNLELDATIDFATSIVGNPTDPATMLVNTSPPAVLSSALLHFSDANITTNNAALPVDQQRDDTKINKLFSMLWPDLKAAITNILETETEAGPAPAPDYPAMVVELLGYARVQAALLASPERLLEPVMARVA